MSTLDEARATLRIRQGRGARHDAPEAPAEALSLVRLGTAFFARKLNELTDAALYADAVQRPGWTRAHVICDLAYHARAISRQVEAVTTGTAGAPVPPFFDSPQAHAAAVDLGATLPPRALRHLFDHAAIHLNVVWRDLPGPGWATPAPGPDGALRPLSRTPMDHARLTWGHALLLGNGARPRDLPPAFRP